MKRFSLLVILGVLAPSVVFAKPTISPVTPTTATVGIPVTLQANVSSAVAIQSCSLWVDLAEIGPMTISGGVASRSYTFTSGGARIAFVFCRDTSGGINSGATTGITVSGAIQVAPPLAAPTPAPTPAPAPAPAPTTPVPAPAPQNSSATSSSLTPEDLGLTVSTPQTASPYVGQLVKTDGPTVYYVGKDGFRHSFPNDRVFYTWYANFDSVQLLSPAELANIPLGKNVTYRPGVKLVKFTTDPKVYAVGHGSVLRWVTSEQLARVFYGDDWNKKIDDIPDTFYLNYTFGADINSASDYNPQGEIDNSKE